MWIASHDFFFLTGRCAYFGGCTKYLDARCDAACPTFFEYPVLEPDKIARAARAKRDLLAHPNVRILANSNYAAEKFREAFLSRGFIRSEIEDKVLVAELGFDVDAFQALSPHIAEDYAGMGVDRDRITCAGGAGVADLAAFLVAGGVELLVVAATLPALPRLVGRVRTGALADG